MKLSVFILLRLNIRDLYQYRLSEKNSIPNCVQHAEIQKGIVTQICQHIGIYYVKMAKYLYINFIGCVNFGM